MRLILWSNLAQKAFDLVKSSNFYAPSKLSFQWFAATHGESGERYSCDVKSRSNASAVPVRSSVLHGCRSHFAAQVFHLSRAPQSTDFFFSNVQCLLLCWILKRILTLKIEDSEIYYIAEDMK